MGQSPFPGGGTSTEDRLNKIERLIGLIYEESMGADISGSAITSDEDTGILSIVLSPAGGLKTVADGLAIKSNSGNFSFSTDGIGMVSGPTFDHLHLTTTIMCAGLTDGHIPYHNTDALGLDDSNIWTDGTNLGIGMDSANNLIQVLDLINFDNTRENTFLGYGAGRSSTAGAQCTAVGYLALSLSNTHYQTAFGYNALKINNGGNNTVVGCNAMPQDTWGVGNTVIGHKGLYASTTTRYCTIIGYEAGLAITTGWENTAVGSSALNTNQTGRYITAIGISCLAGTINVNGSVGLGYKAGFYETAANKLYIDNAQRTSEADGRAKALIYGIFAAATANQYLYFNAHVTIAETLTLIGGLTVPTIKVTTGAALGSILVSDADGDLTYIADVAAGSYLRSGGVATNPLWSTLTLPNTATAFKLAAYTATDVMTELAAVGATGEYLAGATGAIPVWATLNQAAVPGLTTGDSPLFAGLTLTADLPISEGGTGQSTAQAAIDALTAVSGATNEHVLTKDTVTGNAIFKAAAPGGGASVADIGSTAETVGGAVDNGTAVTASRSDHKHAITNPKIDALATADDNTTLNANTTNHGLLLKATAPAAGLMNFVGLANGETAYLNKPLFDTNNPADLGTATPGTQLIAARRDHVHTLPALLSDGDKGDITVSSAGTVWTIDNNAVTLAKLTTQAAETILANATSDVAVPTALTIAEQTLLGRITGGHVVGLTAAQVKTLLAVAQADVVGLTTSESPTFAGLALGSGNITMTGSLGTTGDRLTAGWFADLTVTNSVVATTVKLSGLTDGYVPYHVADATGLENSPIFIDGTNVGIGTVIPGSKLSFGTYVGSAGEASHIRLYENGENIYGIGISNYSLNLVANQTLGTIKFYTDSINRVVINDSGFVGISKSSPEVRLDLGSDFDITKIYLYSAASYASGIGVYNPDTVRIFGDEYNKLITFGYQTKAGVFTEGMRLKDGKLGIADTAPSEKLDVTGNINVTGVYKVDDVQVIGNRVIDARINDTINTSAWDSTTAGVLDALRDAAITHGWIAAA